LIYGQTLLELVRRRCLTDNEFDLGLGELDVARLMLGPRQHEQVE
jgi:hypothetical protein